jgi:hypothetical protein
LDNWRFLDCFTSVTNLQLNIGNGAGEVIKMVPKDDERHITVISGDVMKVFSNASIHALSRHQPIVNTISMDTGCHWIYGQIDYVAGWGRVESFVCNCVE